MRFKQNKDLDLALLDMFVIATNCYMPVFEKTGLRLSEWRSALDRIVKMARIGVAKKPKTKKRGA